MVGATPSVDDVVGEKCVEVQTAGATDGEFTVR
jgi:hypothetical protein